MLSQVCLVRLKRAAALLYVWVCPSSGALSFVLKLTDGSDCAHLSILEAYPFVMLSQVLSFSSKFCCYSTSRLGCPCPGALFLLIGL
jgi:hypothetical protein